MIVLLIFLLVGALVPVTEGQFLTILRSTDGGSMLEKKVYRDTLQVEISAHEIHAHSRRRISGIGAHEIHAHSLRRSSLLLERPVDDGMQDSLSSLENSAFSRNCQDPDPQGRAFQLALKSVVSRAGVRVAYLLSPYLYVADHLFPAICAMPGPIIRIHGQPKNPGLDDILTNYGIPLDSLWIRTIDQIHQLVTSGQYIVFACNDDLADWWTQPFGKFLGRMNTYRNTFTITHGIDEDLIWGTNDKSKTYARFHTGKGSTLGYEQFPFPTLLFTKTAARIRPRRYRLEAMRRGINFDPDKKTILFLCKETCGRMQKQDAESLNENFNFLISPHPKHKEDKQLKLPKWAVHFTVVPPEQYPCAEPLVEIADVIIGQPGSLMTLATRYPNKTLIMLSLTPRDTGHLRVPVLDSSAATVLYERPQNWVTAVNKALEDTEENRGRQQSRASYFEYWIGCVDGYEDYRLFMLALDRNLNLDTRDPAQKYSRIDGTTCSIKPRSVMHD